MITREDRLREHPCGCRYDRITGRAMHRCEQHLLKLLRAEYRRWFAWFWLLWGAPFAANAVMQVMVRAGPQWGDVRYHALSDLSSWALEQIGVYLAGIVVAGMLSSFVIMPYLSWRALRRGLGARPLLAALVCAALAATVLLPFLLWPALWLIGFWISVNAKARLRAAGMLHHRERGETA